MENAVATTEQQEIRTANTGTTDLVLNTESFESIMRFARMMASGRSTIPKHLQGNEADCAAVIMQSMQWRMNPNAVAQKTHLVNGVLGYEAQLVNAVITSKAPTKERLKYEWFGSWENILGKFAERESKTKKDDHGHPVKYRVPAWDIKDENGLGIKVWATFKGETEPRELVLLMTQARTRNSTLWADDPRQQLAYLATKRWSRLYCPDVILGVYTPDELDDVEVRVVGSGSTAKPADVAQAAVDNAAKQQAADSGITEKEIELAVMKLELAASNGLQAFRSAWLDLAPGMKAAVGLTERNRIDALARQPLQAEQTGTVIEGEASKVVEGGDTAEAVSDE